MESNPVIEMILGNYVSVTAKTYPKEWEELNKLLDLRGKQEIILVNRNPRRGTNCAWTLWVGHKLSTRNPFHIPNPIITYIQTINDRHPMTPNERVAWVVKVMHKLNELIEEPTSDIGGAISSLMPETPNGS